MIYKNITDIKPNPKNPRVIKDDKFAKLVKSITEFLKCWRKDRLFALPILMENLLF